VGGGFCGILRPNGRSYADRNEQQQFETCWCKAYHYRKSDCLAACMSIASGSLGTDWGNCMGFVCVYPAMPNRFPPALVSLAFCP